MPAQSKGSVFKTRGGYGIRWPENGRQPQRTGFATKTAARAWFDEHIAPRLRRGGPSADITFDTFCRIFLERWAPGKAARTVASMNERLVPARAHFGGWTLAELQNAVDDVAAWRKTLPTDHARYKNLRAMRQVLNAAVRWQYIARNPAVDVGPNAQPRARQVDPLTIDEIDRIADEMTVEDGALVVFAAETGLRTNEWIALERSDVDRRRGLVVVRRRVTNGKLYPDPKTDRHAVPLTPRAEQALDRLPPRIDTPLVFPAPKGGYLDLDNWRLRRWYPALEAAGVRKRGVYALRHSFATEALAAGVSMFELTEIMGTSVEMLQKHYGHLASDSHDRIRGLLARRAADAQEQTG
jgi:integrase